MADPNVEAQTQAAAGTMEVSEFDQLLTGAFKPKTDTAKSAIEGAVKTLAEQALQDTSLISDDVIETIQAYIAAIDKCLSDQ
ncbi:MAG: type VI secretion system contractile sheath large subunit, partial [Planctomycetota bacterium]